MSAHRTTRWLVRLYPRAWRERYGGELEALILQSAAGRRVPWRTRADVALSALREHAHRLAPGGPASERCRAGMMLAVWAWMLFVCAGATVQKVSEHWEGSLPSSERGLPSAAFDGLLAGALTGGVVVLGGLAILLPSTWSTLRADRGRVIRTPLMRSGAATLVTLTAGVVISVWARHLTASQRDGHDLAYATAFVAFALLVALFLASWAATAGALVRRIEMSKRVVRAESVLACGLAAAMLVATMATLAWWGSASSSAPAFLAARPRGTQAASGLPLLLGGALVAMLIATVAAGIGARAALSASRSLPPDDTGAVRAGRAGGA